MNSQEAMTAAAAPLDFGSTPLARPALLAAGLIAIHPVAYWVGGGPAILALAFIDPLLIVVLIQRLLKGAGVLSMRSDRLRHYRAAGIAGDTFFLGSSGNFFVASTIARKLFADNAVHDFDDVGEIAWSAHGYGVLDVNFTKGPIPFARLLMTSGHEAASAAQRLRNVVGRQT